MDNISIIDLSQFEQINTLSGFYANKLITHIRNNKSLITKPHKHNSYLYILFTKGSGKHEIDFSVYEVKPGNCFVISPGQTHHWTLSEDCDGYIFTHALNFYDLYFTHNRIRRFPFFQSVTNNPLVEFDLHQTQEIAAYFDQILLEYRHESSFRLQKIIALTELIYIATSRDYLIENSNETAATTAYFQKFREFEDLVEIYFLTHRSAVFYADLMNISAKHLNRIAKTISGKTTTDIILERTLLEAKRKIIHQKQSLTQISIELGFEDYAYFSRVFKNKTGQTPSDFQKLYQTL